MAGGPISTPNPLWEIIPYSSYVVPPKIIIPTVLQAADDIASYFANLTCIYNPNFSDDQYDKAALPICIIHVTKMTETHQNQASQKRVLLYEPTKDSQDTRSGSPFRGAAVQTVVDNIVKQPKTYQIEAIVPFKPLDRYFKGGIYASQTLLEAVLKMFTPDWVFSGFSSMGRKATDTWKSVANSIFSSATSGMSVAMAALNVVEKITDAANSLGSINGVSYINKNSLEAMADAGVPLCMKTWMGYDYRYVVITGLSIDKQPTEDGMFRASIQMQEMPVLTMAKPKRIGLPKASAGILNKAFASALKAMSGVDSAV